MLHQLSVLPTLKGKLVTHEPLGDTLTQIPSMGVAIVTLLSIQGYWDDFMGWDLTERVH